MQKEQRCGLGVHSTRCPAPVVEKRNPSVFQRSRNIHNHGAKVNSQATTQIHAAMRKIAKTDLTSFCNAIIHGITTGKDRRRHETTSSSYESTDTLETC